MLPTGHESLIDDCTTVSLSTLISGVKATFGSIVSPGIYVNTFFDH
jgi:hypothetical protein